MSPTKLVVPFLCGCLTPLVIGHAIVDAASQGGAPGPNVRICIDKNDVMRLANGACPNDQRSLLLGSVPSAGGSGKAEDTTPDNAPNPSLDQAKLKDLTLRLIKLEEMGCAALRKNRVVAPFEVVDSSGRIFVVIREAAGLFRSGLGIPVAGFAGDQQGGRFFANGGDIKTSLGVDRKVIGVNVSEGGKSKVILGKDVTQSNYKLTFLSTSSQILAGVGENPDGNGGLVVVSDGSGKQRAIMEALPGGTGRVGILGAARTPIVALTDDGRGGVFYACGGAGRCDPVTVSAGTNESGVGVVATGPRFFTGGPTGAPGSFLIGRR